MSDNLNLMDKLVSLCKRRGYVYPNSEIYGGFASTWDYGPLGAELLMNIKQAWWRDTITARDDVVGLNSAILSHPGVWQASGHLEHFSDPLVDCKQCKRRFRADQIDAEACPECGGELTDVRQFNTMFKTFVGPVEDDASAAYLRPETAQAIFVNFRNVQQSSRMKLPFGIAQIGKAFRNEITTGNFIFRTREFEMMEMEYFIPPGEDKEWFEYWISERLSWYRRYGLNPNKLHLRAHDKAELAHYSRGTTDIEYDYPFGRAELEGVANRGDYDLGRHQEVSGRDLTYFDNSTGQHVLPWVVEPSVGVDRCALAFLTDAYHEEDVPSASGKMQRRTVLRLDPRLAPVKVAFFPLIKREPLQAMARELQNLARVEWLTYYDETGAIGRRYRRQDEAGTPYCVTVDFDSLEDGAVTVRDRDTLAQDRIPNAELMSYLKEKLAWSQEARIPA